MRFTVDRQGPWLAVALLGACGQVHPKTLDAAVHDDGGRPDVRAVVGSVQIPEVLDLPYVVAGQGGTTLTVAVTNPGQVPVEGFDWVLSGSESLHLVNVPQRLAPHTSEALTLSYDGADSEEIERAVLAFHSPAGPQQVPVYGVTGDPALGPAKWESVVASQGVSCGEGATVSMPTAPFPSPGELWTDSSVRVFVPSDFRERGSQDLVLHFHGFWGTVASVLSDHQLQEHLYYSGDNAILVVPQGPVVAPSCSFGKLMSPEGTEALLREVLVLLYREGKILEPVLGDLVVTAHSGGYLAVAANLDDPLLPVRQLNLFDSIYYEEPAFEQYVQSGGRLRSNYTPLGGTLWPNVMVGMDLADAGYEVTGHASALALRDDSAVIYAVDTVHMASPRIDNAYAEQLRWGELHSRKGPRISLRTAVGNEGMCKVTWLSPNDEDLVGFEVETSADGVVWTAAAELDADATAATFDVGPHGAQVRVRPRMQGVSEADWEPSNAYRCDANPHVLAVDHFERVLSGEWGLMQHGLAAMVGEAVEGGVATVSHRAITEDGFDLSEWPEVIWLTGDSAIDDHTFDAAERQKIQAYLAGGGHLIASGSEIGYDLANEDQAGFLASTFGATYVLDDAASYTVVGAGPLEGVGPFDYGGPESPYDEQFPDAFSSSSGGQSVLRYANGMAAAVGLPGKAVVVGFGLELIDSLAERKTVVEALLRFVSPPRPSDDGSLGSPTVRR